MAVGPTPDGYLAWIRGVMNIPSSALPDGSPVIAFSYTVSIATVNIGLAAIPPMYELAVYNLGGDLLVTYAPDQPNSVFFQKLRTDLRLTTFVAGVVSSTSDDGTSTSLLNPDFMKMLTLQDLANLKTPWGRRYLEIAQSWGPLWGVS